jgi:hypothetical protein
VLECRRECFHVCEYGIVGKSQLFKGLRNIETLDALHRPLPAKWAGLRWSGPVAFRKHAPGPADRAVSAPRGWLGRNMDDLSGSGKM